MKREEIVLRLQEIFRDIFADKKMEIHEQLSPVDLETWDSIRHISLIEAIQDDFDILFDFDEIAEMKDVSDIVSSICKKL